MSDGTVDLVVALIAAAATVAAALVGILVTRMESNDQRSRLLRDVEILGKLDNSPDAHALMKDHVETAVCELWESSRRRKHRMRFIVGVFWWFLLLTAAVALWTIENIYDLKDEWDTGWNFAFYAVIVVLFVVLIAYAFVQHRETRETRETRKIRNLQQPGDATRADDTDHQDHS